MKKYFAKYLPVEGEINDGDWFFFEGKSLPVQKDSKLEKEYPLSIDNDPKIKVKLFLCSRDIQTGDKVEEVGRVHSLDPGIIVYNVLDDDLVDSNWGKLDRESLYKVIGEISPEATWVKEGDEFYEGEVKKVWMNGNSYNDWIEGREELGYKPTFLILGSCKHFH